MKRIIWIATAAVLVVAKALGKAIHSAALSVIGR